MALFLFLFSPSPPPAAAPGHGSELDVGQEVEVWARQWAWREALAAEESACEELVVVEMLDGSCCAQ